MRIPGFVLGYHGCDRDVAEAILSGKAEVRSSTNSYDWLGSGAYDTVRAPFFEGDALFDGSKLSEKSHIQWSVRDPKQSVIAYFRPRDPRATEA